MNKMSTINNDSQMTSALGECFVITELIKQDWVALNANTAVRNHKSIDVVCVKYNNETWEHESALIQVKARRGKDFPTGFSLKESVDLNYLKHEVKGPYVFVHIDKNNTPDFYILSRSQFIKLLYELHDRYVNKIKRQKQLNVSLPAELTLKMLQGHDGNSSKGVPGFKNPFPGNIFHNNWKNIWED